MITVDRVLNYFICAPCGREFTYETGLLQHCRSSRLHDGLWCEQCKHLSGDDWTQAAHMRDWHGQQDLNRQNNVHRQRDVYGQPPMAGPDPPGYELCQFCNRNFHSQAQLTMHLTHVHNYCSTCQTLCDDYNSHLLDFHGQCPECGEQFQNAYNLYMVCDANASGTQQGADVSRSILNYIHREPKSVADVPNDSLPMLQSSLIWRPQHARQV